MDQQTLGCKYPTIYTPDMDCSSSINPANNTMLRTSHSDSRIHVPHPQFMSAHGFHTNLPSLFENVSNFNSQPNQHLLNENMNNVGGAERKQSLSNKTGLDRNKSAFELCSNDVANNETASNLRKTSSVANYDNIEDHSSIPRQGSNSFLSSAFHFVTGAGNNSSLAVQKIPEDDEEGGLRMFTSSSSLSPSALTSSSSLHADPIVHSKSTHLTGNNLADISSLTEKNKPRAGGMLGLFNKGFFAKPVLDEKETTYKYILCADKF